MFRGQYKAALLKDAPQVYLMEILRNQGLIKKVVIARARH